MGSGIVERNTDGSIKLMDIDKALFYEPRFEQRRVFWLTERRFSGKGCCIVTFDRAVVMRL